MSAESKNHLSFFPLTEHEYKYLTAFARGHQPTPLAESLCVSRRAVNHVSTSIRGKLASRTTAQAVFKAWKIGIELPPTNPEQTTQSNTPLLDSLPKTPVGILRRLAGGYHSIELDQALKIGHLERIRTIKDLYDTFSATTHPQLIARVIETGFFDRHTAIAFSEQKNTKNRGRDRLTEYQLELLGMVALGKTYKQMSQEISAPKERSVSEEGIHQALFAMRAKLARLSGHPVNGPYQTAITASELGLLPLRDYFNSLNIDPNSIQDLPPDSLSELTKAYKRVVEGGPWTGEKRFASKGLVRIYRSIGAENAVQATLAMHTYRKVQNKESLKSIQLIIPGQPTVLVRKIEIEAIEGLTFEDLHNLAQDLPRNGLVPADIENKGGRLVNTLASILKGDTHSYIPDIDDLTYRKLHESYRTLCQVLAQNRNIPNLGSLLRFIDQRLRQIK